jgi:excisionase family DNA binding protein
MSVCKEGPPQLLSISAVCERLGISRRTVYHLIARGELATCHVGRRCLVSTVQLREFVASHVDGQSTRHVSDDRARSDDEEVSRSGEGP